MSMRRTCSAVVAFTLALPVIAEAAPRRRLNLRDADRAIDLGWQAELAGDAQGARAALADLVKTATTQDELAGRERLEDWLSTLERREQLFREHGRSVRGYQEAFGTLRDFGLRRSSLLWERAGRELPAVAQAASRVVPVRVQVEGLRGSGLARQAVLLEVGRLLAKGGLSIEAGKGAQGGVYELRLFVESEEVTELERGVKVTSVASGTLRDLRTRTELTAADGPPGRGRVVAQIAKNRTEVRRAEADARVMASRRALDDLSQAVIFHVRRLVLEEVVAAETGKG